MSPTLAAAPLRVAIERLIRAEDLGLSGNPWADAGWYVNRAYQELAVRCGVSPRTIERLMAAEHVSIWQADRVLTRLHMRGEDVWGREVWEQGILFEVEEGRRREPGKAPSTRVLLPRPGPPKRKRGRPPLLDVDGVPLCTRNHRIEGANVQLDSGYVRCAICRNRKRGG